MSVAEITNENFETEVLKADKPVLVDFWAAWCGPCKMVAPVVEELAEDFADDIKVGKVNVDEHGEVPARYGIMSIPTLILFKNGQEVGRSVGYKPKEELASLVKELV